MGARTGSEVLAGLKDGRAVWIDGERVADVTADPRFRGAARTLAELYDLQHEPAHLDEMTFVSPASGARVGLSFIEPKTREDLARRRGMVKRWNDHTLGMFGRSPDFLNVLMTAFAIDAHVFGAYAENVRHYQAIVRERDLALTHSLTNPQVDRSRPVSAQDKDVAARIVKETDRGIVVNGARMLATLGAIADEVLVMPAPSYPLPDTDEGRSYAMGFAVPVATPGLRLIARPSLAPPAGDAALSDWPLSARFDETDCLVIFDDVEVPWERVFICRDIERCNAIYPESAAFAHMAHQFAVKNLAKAEFMLGLAFALARATNVDIHQHIHGHLSDVINSTEVVRACIMAAEAEAQVSPATGAIAPSAVPLQCIRFLFPQMFARMTEAIRIIGAGGLFMVPSLAEFDGERAEDVRRFTQAANADARTRTALFRLAYDATLSSFAGRQQHYERYFAGDPVRAATFHYKSYDKAPYLERIKAILADLDERARSAAKESS